MSSEIYQQAKYYEIGYGFVNGKNSLDLFEAFIEEHSRISVHTVLDICCGPSLQLREAARRGYRAIGLDSSADMLAYLRDEASEEQLSIKTVQADMLDFHLHEPVDFCFNMMGSLIYVGDNQGLISHLLSVAGSLKPGGLYLIENLGIDWVSPESWKPISWMMKRDGIVVECTYERKLIDPLAQKIQQTISMEVDDGGAHEHYFESCELKLFVPQEIKTIVELCGQFEFLGFFERETTAPLTKLSPDNIILLRRK